MVAQPRLIICSGFSYSGSSAVVDWLLDHQGVAKFPGGELRLFRSRYGFNTLYTKLGRKGVLDADDLEGLKLLLAAKAPVHKAPDKKANDNARRLRDGFGTLWKKETEILLATLAVPGLKKAAFRAGVCRFITALAADAAQRRAAHTLILDQALRPWLIDRRSFFGDPYVIAVHRDLRDQGVDMIAHGYSLSPDFAEKLTERLERARVAANKANQKALRCWLLRFEDFVLDRGVRAQIRDALELIPKGGRPTFNPAQSAQNIGLHRHSPDYKFIRDLAQAHPQLLYSGEARLRNFLMRVNGFYLRWDLGNAVRKLSIRSPFSKSLLRLKRLNEAHRDRDWNELNP